MENINKNIVRVGSCFGVKDGMYKLSTFREHLSTYLQGEAKLLVETTSGMTEKYDMMADKYFLFSKQCKPHHKKMLHQIFDSFCRFEDG